MTDHIVQSLADIVGANACKTDPADLEPHVTEWRDVLRGQARALVAPGSTEEVAEVVRTCADAGVGIVPQGGNTGLCGGAIPDQSGEQVIVSLSRMNRVRSLDTQNFSMIAEAGCVLQSLQEEARQADLYFPLSLSAEGSCQIGGNLATNAGGINVIRYGSARQQVLGLEVVLADGTVLDTLRSLRKDNTGYDLVNLFVGSEGTLGIITAASLRLYPHPGDMTTAFIAIPNAASAVELLAELRVAFGDHIEAFELISRRARDFVERHIPDTKIRAAFDSDWYVLLDVSLQGNVDTLEQGFEAAVERGLVQDAVIAKSINESESLWRMRHSISEAQKFEGPSIKHDISVPISAMRDFLENCEASLRALEPDSRPVIFGHVGDGNLHYNVTVSPEVFGNTERVSRVIETIYDLVARAGGSFSAEHGIGVTRKAYLEKYRSDAEISLMRQLKNALDPQDTLNPGKVI